MPGQQTTQLSPTELAYLHSSLSLSDPIRPDARSPTTFRPLVAESDFLPATNGSARLCFADGMEGIAGVKAEIERTISPSRPVRGDEDVKMGGNAASEGRSDDISGDWINISIDMPGQRDDDYLVTFLERMIHEGLVADESLPARLRINARWHWKLSIDILLLSPPASYPLPLLSLSTHLALLSTRLPALISQGEEDPLFNDDWDAATSLYPATAKSPNSESSPITKPPVTLLTIAVGSNIFFDPSREELAVADAVVAVTITTNPASEGNENTTNGASILAIRTIETPARFSSPSSAALGGEPGFVPAGTKMSPGTWQPQTGGLKRAVISKIVTACSKSGGVGEEILNGLNAFVG